MAKGSGGGGRGTGFGPKMQAGVRANARAYLGKGTRVRVGTDRYGDRYYQINRGRSGNFGSIDMRAHSGGDAIRLIRGAAAFNGKR